MRCAFLSAILLGGGMLPAMGEVYFGFAPLDPDYDSVTAQGTGKNAYAEASVTLDPAANVAVARLKGKKILGVRCYMRSDYPQKSKRTSSVNVRVGALDAEPEKIYADFFKGWNEIRFDTPVEIGDEAIHIGPMVYETSGNPYPFVSVPGGAMPGGYNISLNKGEWQKLSERGNLLMQLIVDAAPEELARVAIASPYGLPPVVAPDAAFLAGVTVHNFSATPIEEAEIMTVADDGAQSIPTVVSFDPPLAAGDSRNLEMSVPTGSKEDPQVGYAMSVSALNGEKCDGEVAVDFSLHVTSNAYLRVPLVEEFTSMNCVNCPFMAYYLDMAIEDFDRPLVYITRHTGFASDLFTLPSEKELLYLFGTKGTYNPAIMYDRTVWAESDACPVYGADPNPSPAAYKVALERSAARPAYAKILVDAKIESDGASCVVHGKIADGISIDGLYLTTSLIENGIAAEGAYRQSGVYDAADDAPEDLAERFKHNGIVRIEYNAGALGDPLEVDAATREFRVEYPTRDVASGWNLDNCEIVAFISRVNKDDLTDNYVLNAGGNHWNRAVGDLSGVGAPLGDGAADWQVLVGADGRLLVTGDCRRVEVYDMAGARLNAAAVPGRGIYIVRMQDRDGMWHSRKIAVR